MAQPQCGNVNILTFFFWKNVFCFDFFFERGGCFFREGFFLAIKKVFFCKWWGFIQNVDFFCFFSFACFLCEFFFLQGVEVFFLQRFLFFFASFFRKVCVFFMLCFFGRRVCLFFLKKWVFVSKGFNLIFVSGVFFFSKSFSFFQWGPVFQIFSPGLGFLFGNVLVFSNEEVWNVAKNFFKKERVVFSRSLVWFFVKGDCFFLD